MRPPLIERLRHGRDWLVAVRAQLRRGDTAAATPLDRRRFFGPMLLIVHGVVTALSCVIALALGDGLRAGPLAVVGAAAIALLTMPPLVLVVWAFLRERIPPAETVAYMFGHLLLVILAYAAIFGLLEVKGEACGPTWTTALYLSVVTFTTLGYGDCTPVGPARAFAAGEALLSYVFVGIVVGAVASLRRAGDP